MKFLILSGNPKQDGLCKSIENEITRGAQEGGAEVTSLTFEKFGRCRVCGNGWGTCRSEQHRCVFGDDGFDDAQAAVLAADAICILTPVYFGDTAESLKCFLDRFRRCGFGVPNMLSDKQVLIVASPGGSGNGLISCLDQLDRFCRHTTATIFDYIGVNRWNADYKKECAYKAALAIATGRKNGDTV